MNGVVFLANGFEDIEAISVIDVLRRAGIDILTVGIGVNSGGAIISSRNIEVKVDKNIEDLDDSTLFDLIVVPGGMPGASNISKSEKANKIIEFNYKQNRLIAAICAAPGVVLAPLGVLDNRSATCYPSFEKFFNSTTKKLEDGVVFDKNVITANGPASALEFSYKIVEILLGYNSAKQISESMMFKNY